MSAELEAPLPRVSAGASPEQVLAATLPEELDALLQRCAVPRWVDGTLVAELARPLGVDADRQLLLLDGPLFEPVGDGRARLNPSLRRAYLARWWGAGTAATAVPSDLLALSKWLVGHFEKLDPIEALYHLSTFDEHAAATRFEELYRLADEAFALPRCRDLLVALEGLAGDVPDGLLRIGAGRAELRSDYRRYLDARGRWIDDFYRTESFVQPRHSAASIRALVSGKRYRVLQLWAPGGIGKTMHLRHLIARLCVPKPERIACARIDFDAIRDLSAALGQPWLVLVEAAAQLDPQLRQGPFYELLTQYGDARRRLWLGPDPDAERLGAARERSGALSEPGDVEARFIRALGELEQGEQVVIVLDTLEVAVTYGDPEREAEVLVPLLRTLAAVHDGARAVRLVFAGRYDLSERVRADSERDLPGFAELFPTARTVQLKGLAADEARAYLTDKRGETRPDIVRAQVRAALLADTRRRALPMKLALIADVVEQRPDLTAAELREYRDVDVLYLIERVIERVEPAVQWALRYGVIPRALDRRFLDQVMWKHLGRGWAGATEADAPEHDRLPPRRRGAPPLWPADVGAVDPDGLWARLLRYAGASSWVDVVTGETDVVRFHPDVVNPMRGILAGHDVFADLQRDAAAYFERRAVEEPERWARWTQEAAFHRFQLDGPAAGPYWRERLASAAGPERAADRQELATDLLGADYLDARGRPHRRGDGSPVLDGAILTEARFELAWATLQLAAVAGRPATSSRWRTAALLLDAVEHAPAGAVPARRIALARATVLAAQEQFPAAEAALERALDGPADADTAWGLAHVAERIAGRDPDRAAALETAALDMLETTVVAPDLHMRVAMRLVRRQVDRGDIQGALERVEALPATGAPEPALIAAGLRLLAGTPVLNEDPAAGTPQERAREQTLEARARRFCLQGISAHTAASHAFAAVTDLRGDAASELIAAEALEVVARTDLDVLRGDVGFARLEQAAATWEEHGDPDGICRCHALRAVYELREVGDLERASAALDDAERVGAAPGGAAWVACRLLRAELAARAGTTEEAAIVADALEAAQAAQAPLSLLVELAQAGLALGDAWNRAPYLERLLELLGRVTPPLSRLVMLSDLWRCPPLAHPRGDELRALVPSGSAIPSGPAQLALLLRDAELDRVVGRRAQCAATLRDARPSFAPWDEPGQRAWLAAVRRARVDVPPPDARELENLDSPVRAALMHAALLIEAALIHPPPVARELATAAAPLLGGLERVERMQALLHEAVARANPEEAGERLRLAADYYAKLHDVAERDRVLREAGAAIPLAADADGPGVVVELSLAGSRLVSESRKPAFSLVGTLPGMSTRPMPATAETVARRCAEALVEQGTAFQWELNGGLGGPAASYGPPTELRIRSRNSLLHIPPWELARSAENEPGGPLLLTRDPGITCLYRTTVSPERDSLDVQALQIALRSVDLSVAADGALGPRTVNAIAEFQYRCDLPVTGMPDPRTEQVLLAQLRARPAVTIVRPPAELEVKFDRGSRSSGVPIDYLYRDLGFAVHVVEGRLDKLAPATIVHINAGLQTVSGKPFVNLGAEALSATRLVSALSGWPHKPLVVLDPPAPRGAFEIALQLHLRNAFAADLFGFHSTLGVLATGLVRYRSQEHLYSLILEPLAGGAPLGAIINRIHGEGPPDGGSDLEHLIAFAGAALFTRDAHTRLPAVQ